MKNLYLFAILLVSGIGNTAFAQALNWEWAKSAAQVGTSGNESISSDAAGNIYVTGAFSSPTITFGSYTLTNNSLANGSNIFLVKYDSSGHVLWAKSIGGTASDAATGISMDGAGDVFVTGFYTSQIIIFGNDTFINNLPGVTHDFFLAKFDGYGNIYWATNAGIAGTNNYQSMSTDVLGDVYTTGSFTSPYVIIGTDTLKNTHGSSGNPDAFIIKYNLTGAVTWTQTLGGATSNGLDYGQSITTDAAGNIYVTGYYTQDVIRFTHDTLTGSGFFLIKYNSTGAEAWAKSAGGAGFITENSQSITTDAAGNIFVTGNFTGPTMVFRNTSLTNANSNVGSTALYLVKYDTSGNVLWADGAGGTGFNIGNSVSVDDSGDAYITGGFGSSFILFGGDGVVDTANGAYPGGIFVVKYDAAGNVLWATGTGGEASDVSSGISTDVFGDVYITGYFHGNTITFGNTTLGDANNIDDDFFVAKYGSHMPVTGVPDVPPSSNSIKVYPNPSTGSFYFAGVISGSIIEVYNVLGETVYSSTVNDSNYWLNLSGQAKGVYFYRIDEPGGRTTWSRQTAIQQGKIVLE